MNDEIKRLARLTGKGDMEAAALLGREMLRRGMISLEHEAYVVRRRRPKTPDI